MHGSSLSDADTREEHAGTCDENAGTSEKTAGTTEENAGTSEKNAGTSRKNAGTSEKDAGTSEKNAGTSEKDAGAREENSRANREVPPFFAVDASKTRKDARPRQKDPLPPAIHVRLREKDPSTRQTDARFLGKASTTTQVHSPLCERDRLTTQTDARPRESDGSTARAHVPLSEKAARPSEGTTPTSVSTTPLCDTIASLGLGTARSEQMAALSPFIRAPLRAVFSATSLAAAIGREARKFPGRRAAVASGLREALGRDAVVRGDRPLRDVFPVDALRLSLLKQAATIPSP